MKDKPYIRKGPCDSTCSTCGAMQRYEVARVGIPPKINCFYPRSCVKDGKLGSHTESGNAGA